MANGLGLGFGMVATLLYDLYPKDTWVPRPHPTGKVPDLVSVRHSAFSIQHEALSMRHEASGIRHHI